MYYHLSAPDYCTDRLFLMQFNITHSIEANEKLPVFAHLDFIQLMCLRGKYPQKNRIEIDMLITADCWERNVIEL